MLQYVRSVLDQYEVDAERLERADVFRVLRQVGLADFGEVLLQAPMPDYPKLSALLPSMASDEVQTRWTGTSGYPLLVQSCAFIQSVAYNYSKITGRPLSGATVLDYGCGYGRLARLMYYFVGESALIGVDPWDRSIEECKRAGLGDLFFQSEFLPQSLPVGERKFDLVYSFSVFTHLSEKAALTALQAIRRYILADGVLCITIRPPEYWDLFNSAASDEQRLALRRLHDASGFAFLPHAWNTIENEEPTYGDTSMSFDWIRDNLTGWTIVAVDRSLDDAYQIYVFLRPAL